MDLGIKIASLIGSLDTCTAPNAVRCKCTTCEEHAGLLDHRGFLESCYNSANRIPATRPRISMENHLALSLLFPLCSPRHLRLPDTGPSGTGAGQVLCPS